MLPGRIAVEIEAQRAPLRTRAGRGLASALGGRWDPHRCARRAQRRHPSRRRSLVTRGLIVAGVIAAGVVGPAPV
jgi:hypothetical protein